MSLLEKILNELRQTGNRDIDLARDGSTTKLSRLRAGTDDTDAVNVSQLNSSNSRILNLENSEKIITYYEVVAGTSSGDKIDVPEGATILLGKYGDSEDAILSTVNSGDKYPKWRSPKDSSNQAVTTSLATDGTYTFSSTPVDADVAIVFTFSIKEIDYLNLNKGFIIYELENQIDWTNSDYDFYTTESVVAGSGNTKTITLKGVTYTGKFLAHTETATDFSFLAARHSDTPSSAGTLALSRSRGSHGSPTVVQTGDTISMIAALGYDGTDYEYGARIDFNAVGTIANNKIPTQIVFKVMGDASGTLDTALTIHNTKNLTANGNIIVNGLTASRIVETNGSKQLISAAKSTAYNKNFGRNSDTVAEGDSTMQFPVGTNPTITDVTGSVSFATPRTPSATLPTVVYAVIEFECDDTETVTVDVEIGGTIIASPSNHFDVLGVGVTGISTIRQFITFTVPANVSYEFTASGTGTATIISVKEQLSQI